MPADSHVQLVEKVCRLIDENLEEPLTLADLGDAVDVSPAHLQRIFKRCMGISPRQYLDQRRLGRLKKRLREADTVVEAVFEAGYGSTSRVYERAAEQLGMTPAAYRRGGKQIRMGYVLSDSPLGRLLLAGTKNGISAIYLGDDDSKLIEELRREFPEAELTRQDKELSQWADLVRLHLEGQQPHLDLPLDVRATAFQRRVWQELRRIPRGQTRTYGQVAESIGQPGAARAVARACATNPVSIVIPCHRVIREDGNLGGYRWGLSRKQQLLDNEKDQG